MLEELGAASANLRAFTQSIKERPANVLRDLRKPDRKPGEGVDR